MSTLLINYSEINSMNYIYKVLLWLPSESYEPGVTIWKLPYEIYELGADHCTVLYCTVLYCTVL
jgi:hypothetical protein